MASSSTSRPNQTVPQNAFDQLAPYSAPKSTEPWNIFINHRGSDVKYTLATDIYHKLNSMGFRVFLDVDALDAGDCIPAEIQHAITSATFHIAIFSPNYAESPWCLAELSFMLKIAKNRIIPIFYHVDPSDLRYIDQGKGKYADAFSKHESEGRYTIEKLHEWKEALRQTSFVSGDLVKTNENEATVLKHIVNHALKFMKKTPLRVAEHPHGLDELVQGFESIAGEKEVKITGIVGMGGSGKTTLAKEIFNRNFSSFQKCSFVFDVRDAASRNALPEKQKKLLADLNLDHSPFDHVDEGKVVLANRLSSHRALIILDDVDHIDQLNALLPDKHKLVFKSMVIITTRDSGVLISWGISPSCIFKMPRLHPSHAEQLFCWHAFLQSSPPAEFQTLVQDFVKACDGLPLSLKVLGAQLYGRKSGQYWKSQLNKILRILPGEIQKRLQVSYDALDEEERKMFLDVACFLIGIEESKAIAVWDGSGWSGLFGLETLVNKCLVELVEEKAYHSKIVIRMHDHLRDMGREIASRESPYRLWCPQQIHTMELSTKGIPVRGIVPADSFVAFKEYTQNLMGQAIRRSKRLRFSYGLKFLSVKGKEFTEEFASLSEDLAWLRWEDFPLRNIPSWLALKKLKVLELHNAYELEQLWQDDAEPPLQLSELILMGCEKLQRFPSSVKYLQDLKGLSVKFGGSSLSEELCGLQSLENFFLLSPVLSSLPDGFGNLTSLRNLNLQSCVQLSMLPDSFSQLIHLTDLNLSWCESLSSLPDGFGNLTSLRNLDLQSCVQLSMLPDSFSQLIHLTDLNLSWCRSPSSLPDGFGNLTSLRNLSLIGCFRLSMLPDSFSQLIHLTDLNLSWCRSLSSLPDGFGNLTSLRNLSLISCFPLSMLPDGFGNLTSLRNLDLKSCIRLSMLPDSFSQLLHLTDLNLSECGKLSSLPDGFGNLTSLRNLSLIGCFQLSMLPDGFGNLSSLRKLDLSKCILLNVLPDSFSRLHLIDLLLSNCEMLFSLPEILPVELNKLRIYSCNLLKNVKCIGGLINLKTLKIGDCMQIEGLPSFTDLASLKKIYICNCPKVEKIQGLEHVEKFKMWECPKVEKIEGLELAKSLKVLTAETCWKEAGIQSLGNVERLEEIKLECETISALKPCIQSAKGKECAREVWIKGSAIRLEEPIVNLLQEVSDLEVSKPRVVDGDSDDWDVPDIPHSRKGFFSGRDIPHDISCLYYVEKKEGNGEERKVVCMCYTERPYPLLDSFPLNRAIKVMGRRARVLEAFYQILELLV